MRRCDDVAYAILLTIEIAFIVFLAVLLLAAPIVICELIIHA